MSIEPYQVRQNLGLRVRPIYAMEAKPADLPPSVLGSDNPMLALAKMEGHRKAHPKSQKLYSDAAKKATEKRLRDIETKADRVLSAMKPGKEYMARDLTGPTGMAFTEIGNCLSAMKKKGLVTMVRTNRNAGVWVLA